MERRSFRIVFGDSAETLRKLCLSTKFPHREVRWSTVFYAVWKGTITWNGFYLRTLFYYGRFICHFFKIDFTDDGFTALEYLFLSSCSTILFITWESLIFVPSIIGIISRNANTAFLLNILALFLNGKSLEFLAAKHPL